MIALWGRLAGSSGALDRMQQELAVTIAAAQRAFLPVADLEAGVGSTLTDASFHRGVQSRIANDAVGVDLVGTDFELRFDQ